MRIVIRKIRRLLSAIYWTIVKTIPWLRPIYETRNAQTPIRISMWFLQKIIGFNRHCYWPMHFTSFVTHYRNVYAGVETCPGIMPGCYIQSIGKIYIGDYTQISCNVGLITANHDLEDSRKHSVVENIIIGKYCLIGMNSMILPGVELGNHTIVGAGSVVTKSYPQGYCVIAGNPAELIKHLNPEECVIYKSEYEYHGYIPKRKFEEFRRRHLKV